jgi:hypothetical protein
MRGILWPKTPPANGKAVRRQLRGYVRRQLDAAPKRGKGARRRRFLEHVQGVADRYDEGLYLCYDDPRISQTTNDLEGQNGTIKHHLRKISGRASTSGGTVETAGEFVVGALDAVKRKGASVALADLEHVDPADYATAREELRKVMEPARLYRSIQRAPDKNLADVEREWAAEPDV